MSTTLRHASMSTARKRAARVVPAANPIPCGFDDVAHRPAVVSTARGVPNLT